MGEVPMFDDVADLNPSSCVECGGPHAGGIPVIFGFSDEDSDVWELVEVPGLYRCARCQALLTAGALVSNIDPIVAFAFLTEQYLPRVRDAWTRTMGLAPQVKADLDFAVEAATMIAARLIYCGPLKNDGTEEVIVGDDNQDECGHVVDAAKVLQSIRLDQGGLTYECPHCGDRHPAEELFQDRELYATVESDSKD